MDSSHFIYELKLKLNQYPRVLTLSATLAYKLNLTKPMYVICSHLFWEAYSDVLKELEFIKTFICFDDIDDIKLSVATMASRRVDVTTFEPAVVRGETDVAMVAYSSGTTGMSKGVLLTHLNCIAGSNRGWNSGLAPLQTSYLSNELASSYNILYDILFAMFWDKSYIFRKARNEDCTRLSVVDMKTRATLGPNQRGEICVWSPCLMKGYLGATSSYLDGQGFFLTGDLGYYDDNRQFFVVDRLKDIISYEGYQVVPGEVETVLLGHPAVHEAAVVGKPAGVVGELPTAFVVLQSGAQATETELVDYVAKEINCRSGEKLSYGEFTQHAVSVSAALAELGVARGDTVAVAGEPRATFVPTTLAVVLTGAAYTPIELKCGRAILEHKINLSKPKYVICSRLFWETYADILKRLDFIKTFICFDDIDEIKLSIATMVTRHVDVTTFEPAVVRGETDVAMVAYSSGTTGMSKGVLLTHLNCIAGVVILGHSYPEFLQTCLLHGRLTSPYITLNKFCFLSIGKRIIYSESIPDLKTIQDYQVNIIATVPLFVKHMVNATNVGDYDLSSLKTVYSTSDHLHSTVIEFFKQRYPDVKLRQIYGSTEIGAATVARGHLDIDTTNTIGVAALGATLKVVDTKTRVILGPNQRGEICVRSPRMMKGYLGASSPYLDEQGFYLTGDLGYYDDHKQFYIVDRLRDLISTMGSKCAPIEVESVLLAHPAVRDAGVVGKPMGDLEEVPTAFVVLKPGAKATETELVDHVAKEVSWHMRLRGGVRFVSELPRNPQQKLLRRRLREMLELEEPRDDSIKNTINFLN